MSNIGNRNWKLKKKKSNVIESHGRFITKWTFFLSNQWIKVIFKHIWWDRLGFIPTMACIDNDTLSHKLNKWLSYLIKWLGYLFLLVQLLKIWTHFALTFGKFVTILTKGFFDFSKYNEILILYWIFLVPTFLLFSTLVSNVKFWLTVQTENVT
jgi:hypothetical protein